MIRNMHNNIIVITMHHVWVFSVRMNTFKGIHLKINYVRYPMYLQQFSYMYIGTNTYYNNSLCIMTLTLTQCMYVPTTNHHVQ